MTELNRPLLDAPISGQSLTAELGGRPWQQAPQYKTVDDAIEYYLDKMSSNEFTDQLVDVLEMDVPVTTLANTIQLAGVMEGRHSIDTGMLVLPVIMEMLMLIADAEGIKYSTGMERDIEDEVKDSRIMAGMAKARREILEDQKLDATETDSETESRVSTEEMLAELPKGLMGRR